MSSGPGESTYVDIPVGMATNPLLVTFDIAVYSNSGNQSLHDWFEANIDTSGILLQSGSYAPHAFSDGKMAFVSAAPFPASYDGPPVTGYAYILSPKGRFLASITLSQDNYLHQLGYLTSDDVDALLNSIAANLTFNE
jgi:hypothetical protein